MATSNGTWAVFQVLGSEQRTMSDQEFEQAKAEVGGNACHQPEYGKEQRQPQQKGDPTGRLLVSRNQRLAGPAKTHGR